MFHPRTGSFSINNHAYRIYPSELHFAPKLLIIFLTSLLFASFLSPQASVLGHGLILALPTWFLLLSCMFLIRPKTVTDQLVAHGVTLVFGLSYIGISLLRNMISPNADWAHVHVSGTAICVALWIILVLIRNVFAETVFSIRWISLSVVGISLGAGIPLLVSQPGIARLTMGNSLANSYGALLAPQGVGNFNWYTPMAFAVPVIANWLWTSRSPLMLKSWGWLMLALASISVLVSTFTMAAFMLIIGLVAFLALTVQNTDKRNFAIILSIGVISIVFAPTLYAFASSIGGVEFAILKLTRLYQGITTYGLVAGDETSRMWMFMETLASFFKSPIIGVWGIEENVFVGGHSSWSDILALQGILGLALWLRFLSPSWWKRPHAFSVTKGMAGGTVSWILLVAGGIFNPTFMTQMGLILLWLFDEHDL